MTVNWEEVYRRDYGDLVRFLHRMVWDVDRARDLAQETFARALAHTPDNPRAWLFRVAGNLAKDEARMVIRRREHLVLLKGDADANPKSAPAPDEELDRRERSDLLREALDSLSERDREVLLLWNAGLDYSEIAHTTGLAVGAIGTTLARARKRLVNAHEDLEKRHVARG